ncbi:YARHG domain-containing protein [Flavobacterium sp. UBA7680]|uniref:YARHG domain-containing protein n=1 Tax=Flavobacterium sp. UBA7680 TaxID=1946559 RepID=UPI0025BB96F2|nr:YARHG domain-containing protein [Flavobacterium sp. UBA7680]
MKKLLYLFLAVSLFSCNSKEKQSQISDNKMPEEIRTDLYGSWVGDFVMVERDTSITLTESPNNKINIIIKKITGEEVIGQSIVAGNKRPLKGYMKKKGNNFYFTLKEPGDDKNDGVFTFEIQNDSILKGTWIAYNPKKQISKREFELVKKHFQYDPNVMLPDDDSYTDYENPKEEEITDYGIEEDSLNNKEPEKYIQSVFRSASESITKLNSSTQKLKESDVKNLKKIDLEILRNTIFARHGLSFKTKKVRQFFDHIEWYIPVSTNVDDKLTSVEKENIVLLKRFEKYAEDNYDSFGR